MKNRLLVTSYSLLVGKRNLLAFSHGLDSTALYHLLGESGIDFDIALVNYGVRKQADKEEAAARELARRDGRRIFVARAPHWSSNFEAEARRFRYEFFESLIDEHGYENLMTAHQLNDRLEWMMMRLIRGAGTVELAGMEAVSERETPYGRAYRLIRPLLETPRYELETYLRERDLRWFYDKSNETHTHERNRLRPLLEPLIREYASGITRSFRYLEEDAALLHAGYRELYRDNKLRIYRLDNPHLAPLVASRVLKELGYLLGGREREALRRLSSIVAGRQWAIEYSSGRLYIAPYLHDVPMPKSFKELCRRLGIPAKTRPYLYRENIDPKSLPNPLSQTMQ